MHSHHQVDQLTEAEVLAAAKDLVSAFSHTDTDAYFAAFAPEATFVFYSEAQRLESRTDYETLWKGWLAEGWSVVSCESTNGRVQLCGTSAVFSHTVETTTQTGNIRDTTLEQETIVFARLEDGGQLLAVHEHLSLRLPAGDAA